MERIARELFPSAAADSDSNNISLATQDEGTRRHVVHAPVWLPSDSSSDEDSSNWSDA